MRRLHWSKGNADRCFAAMVHWTESNTAQKNGKASIYLSVWNGQHGLLMLMKLAIKELSDSCIHTLLPSKGSSFSSKSEKRERNMCECDLRELRCYLFFILFLEVVQLIIQTTQNQTSSEWASANKVLIEQRPEWTFSQMDYVINGHTVKPWTSWGFLTVLTWVFLPPHHCRLSSSIQMGMLVYWYTEESSPLGHVRHIQCPVQRWTGAQGEVSHEWRWVCVLESGRKSRKCQRLFTVQLCYCVILLFISFFIIGKNVKHKT